MRKRNWTLFAVLAALAALAALSVGSAGSAVASSASASAASAAGGEKAQAARRRGRRGPRGRRGRRGATGPAGATGAPGPQGPAGTSGGGGTTSGGLTKIFYAVNGVGPTQTLIDVNNLNVQNSCDGNVQTPEVRSQVSDTVVHFGAFVAGGDNAVYAENDDLDIGEVFGIAGADDAHAQLTYANPQGQLVQVTAMVEQGANSTLISIDCLLAGTYTAL